MGSDGTDGESPMGKLIQIPAESISELVRRKLAEDGSLHLDRIQAEVLLRYLVRVEETRREYDKLVLRLEELTRGNL